MPRGLGCRAAWFWSGYGVDAVCSEFVLDRGTHSEGGVARNLPRYDGEASMAGHIRPPGTLEVADGELLPA